MNQSAVDSWCDNSTLVAHDAKDLMTAAAIYPRASLRDLLKGKKGLVTGIANGNSIAYGAARAFNEAGAEIMLTYGHGKTEQYVRPLLHALGNPALLLCDVCWVAPEMVEERTS